MNCLQTVQNIRVSGVRRDRQNSVVLRPSSVSVLYKSKRSSTWNSRLSVSVKAMSAGMCLPRVHGQGDSVGAGSAALLHVWIFNIVHVMFM